MSEAIDMDAGVDLYPSELSAHLRACTEKTCEAIAREFERRWNEGARGDPLRVSEIAIRVDVRGGSVCMTTTATRDLLVLRTLPLMADSKIDEEEAQEILEGIQRKLAEDP